MPKLHLHVHDCTVHVAWIMAEIELYSFASTQDSSESEEDDVHEHKDEC